MKPYNKLLFMYFIGFSVPAIFLWLSIITDHKIFIVLFIVFSPLLFLTQFSSAIIICPLCKNTVTKSPEGVYARTNFNYLLKPLLLRKCGNCGGRIP